MEYLVPGERGHECQALLEDPSADLLVPDLVFVEVANAFRTMMLQNRIDTEGVSELLEDLLTLPLTSFSSRSLVTETVEHFSSLTAYDGAYLALTLERGCDLATFDRSLGAAARMLGCRTQLA